MGPRSVRCKTKKTAEAQGDPGAAGNNPIVAGDDPAVAGDEPAVARDVPAVAPKKPKKKESRTTKKAKVAHSKMLVATILFKDPRGWFGEECSVGVLHYHNLLANRLAIFGDIHNNTFLNEVARICLDEGISHDRRH